MTPEEKVVAKRQAVMAVLDEDWNRLATLTMALAQDATAHLYPPRPDPETCGHEFKRHEGLPNAVCTKCGAELVPPGLKGAPLDGFAKMADAAPKPKDTPCPNRGLGHAWMIFDTYVDRCAACKATRPRPKSAAAPASAIGDPSDL